MEIQDYPTGTPTTGDLVPYVEDPDGMPALKLVDVSALGGSGEGALYASTGPPNGDPTVPSPPPDTRALAFDRDSDALDLYKWDISGGNITYERDFTAGAPLGVAPNGAAWDGNGHESASISGGAVHLAYAAAQTLVANFEEGDFDVTVTLDGAAGGDGPNLGVCARWQDATNYVCLSADATSTYLSLRLAGSFVYPWAIYSSAASGAGVVLRLVGVGNEYTAYRNGVLLGSYTDTDNNFLTVTNHGLFAQDTTTGFRDLSVTVPDSGETWVAVGSGLNESGGGSVDPDGSDTNTLVVTGTTETVVATSTSAAPTAVVVLSIAVSQNDPGNPKDTTVRLRRTNTSGTVLWSAATGGSSDSTSGDTFAYSATAYDGSPTGTWVLTVQQTSGTSGTEIWSARNALVAFG